MKSTNFTKDCIYNALVELMDTKPFNEIQINEICIKAGYNRSTFYRNYKSKMDILQDRFLVEAEKYKRLVEESIDKSFNYKTVTMFQMLRKSYHIFYQMRKANLDREMYKMFRSIYPFKKDLEYRDYAVDFKTAGVFEVIMRWMEKGMIESNEEMAIILKKIINDCIIDY